MRVHRLLLMILFLFFLASGSTFGGTWGSPAYIQMIEMIDDYDGFIIYGKTDFMTNNTCAGADSST